LVGVSHSAAELIEAAAEIDVEDGPNDEGEVRSDEERKAEVEAIDSKAVSRLWSYVTNNLPVVASLPALSSADVRTPWKAN